MITFEPLFSPWLILAIFIGLGLLGWQTSRSLPEVAFRALALLALVLVGVQFSVESVRRIPPEAPVQVVRESFSGGNYAELEAQLEQFKQQLARSPAGVDLTFEKLDERWDTRPVFDDYNQLSEKLTGAPVEVIGGWGRHTAASPGYFSQAGVADSPARRALLTPPEPGQKGRIELVEPVREPASPGPVEWRVDVSGTAEPESARLVLKQSGEVVRELEAPSPRGRVRVRSPELGEGLHYFTLELLIDDETKLAPGHPRRASVGAVVEDHSRELLIVDAAPGWRSGWWGRKIQALDSWDVSYKYRNFDDPPVTDPDVTLYFGFPSGGAELENFRRLLRQSGSFLFAVTAPENEALAGETLQELGFENERLVRRKDEFELRLVDATRDRFPALLGFKRQLEKAPPVSYLYAALDGAGYRPLLEASGELILGLHEQQARALLTYPDLHRLAMDWGRMGLEETGGEIAREIVQKLAREGREQEGRLFDRRWLYAGEVVRPGGSATSLSLTSPREKSWPDGVPGKLAFPRPGKYRFVFRRDGERVAEELLVVESNEMRYPQGEKMVPGLIREGNIFDSPTAAAEWVRSKWRESHRRETVGIFNWSNPLLLALAGLFLAAGWLARDLRRG